VSAVTLGWFFVGSLLIATCAAIAAHVLRDISGHELEHYCRQKGRLDLLDEILQSSSQIALVVESLQMLSLGVLAVSGGLWLLAMQWIGESPLTLPHLVSLAIGFAVILVISNSWLPLVVVRYFSAPFLFYTWRIWKPLFKLAWPLLIGFQFTAIFFRRMFGDIEASDEEEEEALEEEIRSIVTSGERSGLLEQDAADMIEGVIELDDTTVAQIMTPAFRVDSISVDTSWDELLKFVIDNKHSRIPVYQGRTDNIIGILVTKDLFPELVKRDVSLTNGVKRFLREPQFVPATNSIDELLRQFLRSRNHLAVVIDEYHNVVGIVTIEDVLEEIVGEIEDELDDTLGPEIEKLSDRSAMVSGSTRITDINETLGCQLPTELDFDTIGGLVLSKLHDIPKLGDQVTHENVLIEVTQASRRAIGQLLVRVLERSPT
jgi:CBS domain containing-hemolysin-like protein